MAVVVDVQGFKMPHNRFVMKELAVLPLNSEPREATTFLFKPPFPWRCLPATYRCCNSWLQRNFHGLMWNSGDVPYVAIEEVLGPHLRGVTTVYVKGAEKKAWLQKYTKCTIVNLDELGCPSLRKLLSDPTSRCQSHSSDGYFCAAENAKRLEMWLKHKDDHPSLERSLRIFFEKESLTSMTAEDIAQLPKEFLIVFAANTIDDAWNKLPVKYTEDKGIADCRRCRIHHRVPRGRDDYDGPRPMIKDYVYCQAG